MKKFCLVSLFFVCLFLIPACSKEEEGALKLDDSQPLALAPDVEWAVVTDPYAAYKKESSWSSDVTGHCRKGDILLVKGKSVKKKDEVWYYFEDGWLPYNCLSVYSNRLKAQSVSENLLSAN